MWNVWHLITGRRGTGPAAFSRPKNVGHGRVALALSYILVRDSSHTVIFGTFCLIGRCSFQSLSLSPQTRWSHGAASHLGSLPVGYTEPFLAFSFGDCPSSAARSPEPKKKTKGCHSVKGPHAGPLSLCLWPVSTARGSCSPVRASTSL